MRGEFCRDSWTAAVLVAVDRYWRIGGLVTTDYFIIRSGNTKQERLPESDIRKPEQP